MALIVGAMPGTNWKRIAPLLESLGWSRVEPLEAEEWYKCGKHSPAEATSDKYLLLHSRPEIIVANAMSLERDPMETLEQWKASANCLIDFYLNNRERSLLLEVEAILQNPKRFMTSVIKHFQLTPESPEKRIIPDTLEAPPMYQLLANQLLAQTDELSRMIPELQACTLPLSENSYVVPDVDIFSLCEEHRARRPLEKENSLLLEQLHRVQEHLENYFLSNKSLTAKLESALAENKKLRSESKRAKDKVEQIRYSTSWRIMGPARVIKRTLSGSKKP
ncbi:hypothetical protein [Microbulbifer zhoushanensis]|uniref:hypothetical protein n=1 Tax=Microbulbifer TaxID=48073 RepID=UPI001F29DCD9|nr:hypothetical protein [Microbulbifer zhoushanensis]